MSAEFLDRDRYSILSADTGYIPPKADERILLQRAKGGDRDAYAELYRRHAQKAYHVVLRMTGSREDAEDVLQNAAMQAFIHLKSFREQSTFSTWFTRIAINGVLMMRRRERLLRPVPIDSLDGVQEIQLPDPASDTEVQLQKREREQRVQRAIRRLRPNLRVPLQLQLADDLPIKDLASRLGISLSATKSRLLRARVTVGRHVQRIETRSPLLVAKRQFRKSEA